MSLHNILEYSMPRGVNIQKLQHQGEETVGEHPRPHYKEAKPPRRSLSVCPGGVSVLFVRNCADTPSIARVDKHIASFRDWNDFPDQMIRLTQTSRHDDINIQSSFTRWPSLLLSVSLSRLKRHSLLTRLSPHSLHKKSKKTMSADTSCMLLLRL